MPNHHYLKLPNGDVAVFEDKGKGYRNPYLYTIKAQPEDDKAAARAREAYHAAVVAYAEVVVDPNATDEAIIAACDAAAAAAAAAKDAEYHAWVAARIAAARVSK